jgi:cytoskeleton protein RodZ
LTERTHGADAADLPGGQVLQQIGYHLRLAREERGERLEDIAQVLRIRRAYLHCLESGDLADIPGRAYALGFLRSYGDYLGFNGDAIVEEVKRHDEPLPENPALQIREPLPDSHRPPLLLVGASVALAAVVYVGWNYWQNRQEAPQAAAVERVDERPAGTVAAADTPPPAAAPATTPAGAGADAAAAADATELTAAPSSDDDLPPLPAIPEPPMPERADALTAPETPPAEAGADAVADDGDVVTAILEGGGPASEGDGAASADAAEDGTDGTAEEEPRDLLAVAAAETGDAELRTFGEAENGARIVLVAREASWVQVKSTAGEEYVWTRTLEPGDAFFVPNRDDLALWTGNAGGLKVLVDGEPLPSLGEEGEVRRDIPLAAEALSAQYAAN